MKVTMFHPEEDKEDIIEIEDFDTWSIDYTLAPIVLPMLKQLKETKHGSPLVDDSDCPEHLHSTNAAPKVNDYDIDEFYHDRWNWVMNEMIWSFHQKTRDWEDDYVIEHAEFDFDNTDTDEEFSEIKCKKRGQYDHESAKAHQERMSNGFRLFGKYFEALWD